MRDGNGSDAMFKVNAAEELFIIYSTRTTTKCSLAHIIIGMTRLQLLYTKIVYLDTRIRALIQVQVVKAWTLGDVGLEFDVHAQCTYMFIYMKVEDKWEEVTKNRLM